MLHRVHEVVRAEDSWQRPGVVEDELEASDPPIPAGGELSSTSMLEYETDEERDANRHRTGGLTISQQCNNL